VTLRGVVLPVGGIKEKVVAAHRAGMREVLLPAKNEKDLRGLPASVLEDISFTFITTVEQALRAALMPAPAPTTKTESFGNPRELMGRDAAPSCRL